MAVLFTTNLGIIKIELWSDKALITVNNFLSYVDEGFYDGTIFHRVIAGFMIQLLRRRQLLWLRLRELQINEIIQLAFLLRIQILVLRGLNV